MTTRFGTMQDTVQVQVYTYILVIDYLIRASVKSIKYLNNYLSAVQAAKCI